MLRSSSTSPSLSLWSMIFTMFKHIYVWTFALCTLCLAFVKLPITFSISMYITCVIFVQRFQSRGRRFTHFHYNNYYIISPFSAPKQTHCAHVTCDSDWMTVALYYAPLNTHRSGVLTSYWLLHGWRHVSSKTAAISAWRTFCVCMKHSTMSFHWKPHMLLL